MIIFTTDLFYFMKINIYFNNYNYFLHSLVDIFLKY